MLSHVQTPEGRILLNADERARLKAREKRAAERPSAGGRLRAPFPEQPLRAATPRLPGRRLALHHVDLPASPPARWVPSRKEALVEAVRCGQIAFGEACSRFGVAPDEPIGWFALSAAGRGALRATGRRPGRP